MLKKINNVNIEKNKNYFFKKSKKSKKSELRTQNSELRNLFNIIHV